MNDEAQFRHGSRSSLSSTQVTLNPDTGVQRTERVSADAPGRGVTLNDDQATSELLGFEISKPPTVDSSSPIGATQRSETLNPIAAISTSDPTTLGNPDVSGTSAAATNITSTTENNDDDTSIPESQEVFQVVVRFRPLNVRERRELLSYFTSQNDSDSELEDERLCEAVDSLLQICSNKTFTFDKKAYTFDRVFDATTGQRQLYAEVGQGLVRRFVEQPYDLTFIAYGQTSSGKTWTIDGDFYESQNRVTENAGLLFQATADIFRRALDKFRVELSFYEIYCEKIVDLLVDESSGASPPQVQLFDDKRSGKIFMKNLEWRKVSSEAELYALLANARQRRHYSFTEMNANSSRSHTIFDLRLTLRRSKTPEFKNFRVVDLAGSERASRTKATGTTFEEGKKINQSLMDLRSIISQLSRAKNGVLRSPVNHRASKLTRILYPSLHGKSRVVIITCCSQSLDSRVETNGSLQFACYAKKISLKLDDIKTAVSGTSRVSNEASLQRELQRLNDEAQMREQKIQMYEREMNELRELIRTMCEKRAGGGEGEDGDGGGEDGDGCENDENKSTSRRSKTVDDRAKLSDSTTQTGGYGTGTKGVELGAGGETGQKLLQRTGTFKIGRENDTTGIGRGKDTPGIASENSTVVIGQRDGTFVIDSGNGTEETGQRIDTFGIEQGNEARNEMERIEQDNDTLRIERGNGTLKIDPKTGTAGIGQGGGDAGARIEHQPAVATAAMATTREMSTLTESEDVAERELRRYAELLEKEQLKTARYKSTILSQRKLLDQKIHDNELLDQELQMMRMVKELILQQF